MASVAERVRELLAAPPSEVARLHAARVSPAFIEALGLIGYGRAFVRAEGLRLWDEAGRSYLDFLAGYGAISLGHNHPEVRAAIEEALRSATPSFLHIAPPQLAGAVVDRLCRRAPGGLDMGYLMASGSEAVDGALKLARAATSRPRFVAAERAYHGVTLGALSVSGDRRHRQLFEPLLQGCALVPWGDVDAVERQLRGREVAAVILEPIQGEGGIHLPPPGYLGEVARLCRRFGTLLIVDEIQTGLGRTGRMFACEQEGVEPDLLLVAKALSGGLLPISAYLTRADLWRRAYGSLDRHDLHSTTFTGGALACAAAIATLEIIERDRLVERAAELGAYLGAGLREAALGHPLVKDVRGRGLLWGVEVKAPLGGLVTLAVAQWLAVGLMDRGIVTQAAGNAPGVIRAEPPLTVDRESIDALLAALRATLAAHSSGPVSSLAKAAAEVVRGKLRGPGEGRG